LDQHDTGLFRNAESEGVYIVAARTHYPVNEVGALRGVIALFSTATDGADQIETFRQQGSNFGPKGVESENLLWRLLPP